LLSVTEIVKNILFSNSYTSVTVFNEVPIVKIRGHALLIVQPLPPPLNNLESYPAIVCGTGFPP